MSGRAIISLSIYGMWCVQHGDPDKGRLVLDELCARAPGEPALHFTRGTLALMLGDRARAEPAMQRAIAERDPQIFQWQQLHAVFPHRELADDPAYRAALEESGIDAFLRERAARASGSQAG